MTKAEELYQEFTEARHEMSLRQQQFNDVDPSDHVSIDAAIYLMRVAELRFKHIMVRLKQYGGEAA